MDERSKEMLDAILVKSPAELTPNDIGFLKARKTYLTLTDKDKFKEVLVDKPAKKEKKKKK